MVPSSTTIPFCVFHLPSVFLKRSVFNLSEHWSTDCAVREDLCFSMLPFSCHLLTERRCILCSFNRRKPHTSDLLNPSYFAIPLSKSPLSIHRFCECTWRPLYWEKDMYGYPAPVQMSTEPNGPGFIVWAPHALCMCGKSWMQSKPVESAVLHLLVVFLNMFRQLWTWTNKCFLWFLQAFGIILKK